MVLNKPFHSATYSISLTEDQPARGTLGEREAGRNRNTGLHPYLGDQVSVYQRSLGDMVIQALLSHSTPTILFCIVHVSWQCPLRTPDLA